MEIAFSEPSHWHDEI